MLKAAGTVDTACSSRTEKPVYVHSDVEGKEYALTTETTDGLPVGRVVVRARLAMTGQNDALCVLYINGGTVGQGIIRRIHQLTRSTTRSGLRIGFDAVP